MKKVVMIIVSIVLSMFLISCVNYKTQPQTSEQDQDEARLIDEIAKIEQELQLGSKSADPADELPEAVEIEEEVLLPDLDEESSKDGDMQVIEVNENEMVRLNVKITDPDQDSVEYSFTPPLNKLGQWKTNYGDAGEYVVSLTATDGKLTTEKKMKIVVNRVNVPPVVGGVADLHVKEGELVTFNPIVSDPNGDEVSVTVSEPLQSGTFATDHTSAGEYKVTVVASDGELHTEKIFTLLVDDVNELPVLTNLQDIMVKEGETVTIEPKISDFDEDEVVVTISEPVGNSGVWKTGYTDHGEYVVTITADDGKGVVTKKVKVAVEDVNMPPEIIEVRLIVN